MAELGRLYFHGMGVTANQTFGVVLLCNARLLGSSNAEKILWRIGDRALLHAAVKADMGSDVECAIFILVPLACTGNHEAQFQLATIYDRLEGSQNLRSCVALYADAIKGGLSFAWNNLDLLQRANLVSWDDILAAMDEDRLG